MTFEETLYNSFAMKGSSDLVPFDFYRRHPWTKGGETECIFSSFLFSDWLIFFSKHPSWWRNHCGSDYLPTSHTTVLFWLIDVYGTVVQLSSEALENASIPYEPSMNTLNSRIGFELGEPLYIAALRRGEWNCTNGSIIHSTFIHLRCSHSLNCKLEFYISLLAIRDSSKQISSWRVYIVQTANTTV